ARRGRGEDVVEKWHDRAPPLRPASEPAKAPRRAVHEGGRISLVPLDPDSQVDDLYSGSHGDPETESLWTYMAYGPFADRSAMLEWLRNCASSEDPLFLAVRDNEKGAHLGMVSYLAIRPMMRVLELGHIWYISRAQGTGVNTEAVRLMQAEAFDVLGYRRVEWTCDS
ncbi:MAG: GNAT family N-acetyltransferase, partial [Vicinamibacteria bacterium]